MKPTGKHSAMLFFFLFWTVLLSLHLVNGDSSTVLKEAHAGRGGKTRCRNRAVGFSDNNGNKFYEIRRGLTCFKNGSAAERQGFSRVSTIDTPTPSPSPSASPTVAPTGFTGTWNFDFTSVPSDGCSDLNLLPAIGAFNELFAIRHSNDVLSGEDESGRTYGGSADVTNAQFNLTDLIDVSVDGCLGGFLERIDVVSTITTDSNSVTSGGLSRTENLKCLDSATATPDPSASPTASPSPSFNTICSRSLTGTATQS